MKLHWQRVRRARRLPVPLPPKPKRPLGPPVLFGFRDVSIRTRADAIEASGSWEAFLDDMADLYVAEPFVFPISLLDLLERLVPPAEREAHRETMRTRIGERRRAAETVRQALRNEAAEKIAEKRGATLRRWFGRAA